MKATTKNIRQQTFFLWLRWDVDEIKLISDDKNYDAMYAESVNKTRRDGTKMLFEDYRTFKIFSLVFQNVPICMPILAIMPILYDCRLVMPVHDDKLACYVFIYKWNHMNDSFLNETLGSRL